MKKLCFFSGDITRSGGIEKVSAMIANELALSNKYEVCFLSLCEQAQVPYFAIDERIKRYTLGDKWMKPGIGYLPLISKLKKFLTEKEIDVIIDGDIVLDSLAIQACKKLKTKVVSWEHFNCDYELSVFYRRRILKYSVKRSDYIITLTDRDKLLYQQRLNRTSNIETIVNPYEQVISDSKKEKENLIVTAARLVHYKGIDYLAEVAPVVLKAHPDWKWFVLGDGEDRAILEKVIEKENLNGQLVVTGVVEDVNPYLEKAKLFVLTSRMEGLPMCLLEAKAHGMPCISFDVLTGPRELIEEGVNGYLIEPFACDDMISRIEELITDEEKRKLFASKASIHLEAYQIDKIMEKWNKVIDSLCE